MSEPTVSYTERGNASAGYPGDGAMTISFERRTFEAHELYRAEMLLVWLLHLVRTQRKELGQ